MDTNYTRSLREIVIKKLEKREDIPILIEGNKEEIDTKVIIDPQTLKYITKIQFQLMTIFHMI